MESRIFYLNNNGSKWIILENGKKPFETFKTKDGEIIKRIPNYYFSFGNFCGININYKGKKIDVFVDEIL